MAGTLAAPIATGKILVSSKLLLSIYWLIPAALITVFFDNLFFEDSIRNLLPESPEKIFLLYVIFDLPHIIAGSIGFCDTEYLKYYKYRLTGAVALIVILLAIMPYFFGFTPTMIIFSIWTIYHTYSQQVGTCFMLSKTKNTTAHIWKWLGFIIALMIFNLLVTDLDENDKLIDILRYGSLVLCVPFTVVTIKYAACVKEIKGLKMIWFTFAMIVSTWVFYALEYPFFAILIPRVAHDVTAFIFYIAHDNNRNMIKTKNLLYKALTLTGFPTYVVGPLLAISLGYYIKEYADIGWAAYVILAISFFHYITESFAWKNGTPHRKEISLQ